MGLSLTPITHVSASPGYASRPNRAIDDRGLSPHKIRSLVGCSPNGLEMSRPASAWIVPQKAYAAAGRVGSIELLGGRKTRPMWSEVFRASGDKASDLRNDIIDVWANLIL